MERGSIVWNLCGRLGGDSRVGYDGLTFDLRALVVDRPR